MHCCEYCNKGFNDPEVLRLHIMLEHWFPMGDES